MNRRTRLSRNTGRGPDRSGYRKGVTSHAQRRANQSLKGVNPSGGDSANSIAAWLQRTNALGNVRALALARRETWLVLRPHMGLIHKKG